MDRKLKITEITISALGFSLALFLGVIGYLDYKEQSSRLASQALSEARLQTMRAFHSAELEVCSEVSSLSASLLASESDEKLLEKIRELSEIKHGRALVILEKPVMDSLVTFYNKAVDFYNKEEKKSSYNSSLVCAVGESGFAVVHACRKAISRAFNREASTELGIIDESYTLSWATNNCEN